MPKSHENKSAISLFKNSENAHTFKKKINNPNCHAYT